MIPRPLIDVVWEEAHACLLQVSEMMEHLESATMQLTEVLDMLLRRVKIAEALGLWESGSLIGRTDSQGS